MLWNSNLFYVLTTALEKRREDEEWGKKTLTSADVFMDIWVCEAQYILISFMFHNSLMKHHHALIV